MGLSDCPCSRAQGVEDSHRADAEDEGKVEVEDECDDAGKADGEADYYADYSSPG